MYYTPEEQVNRTKWDEVAPIHLRSYGLERLRRRQSMLGEIERRELGDITGKQTLHLQCHIGHDTLSLALAGADVIGVDFSGQSIAIARQLADELQLDARFLVGNVLHLDEVLDERFDLVFTSNGVLCWIRDIELWAKNIGDHLHDGGTFYIYEYHPFAYVFDEENSTGLTPKYDYFLKQPLYFEDEHADYADPTFTSQSPTYEWMWSVGDIQNALDRPGAGDRVLSRTQHSHLSDVSLPRRCRRRPLGTAAAFAVDPVDVLDEDTETTGVNFKPIWP